MGFNLSCPATSNGTKVEFKVETVEEMVKLEKKN